MMDRWGPGPSGLALMQSPWTCGALANHMGSFVGERYRSVVNATSLQRIVLHATACGMLLAIRPPLLAQRCRGDAMTAR